MRFLRTIALALVGVAIFAVVASAAGGILDQSSTTIDNPSGALVSQWHSATVTQTFTAGASGPLTDVQIPIWAESSGYTGSVRMVIHPAPGGVVTAGVTLATTSVNASSLPTNSTPVTWTDFAFSTPPLLVAGSQYAFTVDELSAGHQHFWWQVSGSDVYVGGQASGTVIFPSGGDVAFQTYLSPSAPPNGGGRAGYCSVAGDTWVDGTPIPVGSFLDLRANQPEADPHYAGATTAIYLEGAGLSCDAPPGYRATGDTVGYGGFGSAGPFAYYRRTG
jgi:hypothetical protein